MEPKPESAYLAQAEQDIREALAKLGVTKPSRAYLALMIPARARELARLADTPRT